LLFPPKHGITNPEAEENDEEDSDEEEEEEQEEEVDEEAKKVGKEPPPKKTKTTEQERKRKDRPKKNKTREVKMRLCRLHNEIPPEVPAQKSTRKRGKSLKKVILIISNITCPHALMYANFGAVAR
jgi:hypothetical protein